MIGAANEGFVGWWGTKEISSERVKMLKGKRESVFERGEFSFIENAFGMGKVIEELASHIITRTCIR